MEGDATSRRVFDAEICGSRRRGGPCISWKNQIKEPVTPVIDCCDQLAQARLEESVTAGRNPLNGLLLPIKQVSYGSVNYSQTFCQNSAERKSLKKYFSYFALLLGLEPTHYPLDYGDFIR